MGVKIKWIDNFVDKQTMIDSGLSFLKDNYRMLSTDNKDSFKHQYCTIVYLDGGKLKFCRLEELNYRVKRKKGVYSSYGNNSLIAIEIHYEDGTSEVGFRIPSTKKTNVKPKLIPIFNRVAELTSYGLLPLSDMVSTEYATVSKYVSDEGVKPYFKNALDLSYSEDNVDRIVSSIFYAAHKNWSSNTVFQKIVTPEYSVPPPWIDSKNEKCGNGKRKMAWIGVYVDNYDSRYRAKWYNSYDGRTYKISKISALNNNGYNIGVISDFGDGDDEPVITKHFYAVEYRKSLYSDSTIETDASRILPLSDIMFVVKKDIGTEAELDKVDERDIVWSNIDSTLHGH